MTDLLQQAIHEHQAGHEARAEELYRAALKETPHSPDALALLGVICDAKGHYEEALSLITQAIKLDSNSALFKLYLGNTLLNLHRIAEAIVVFRQATILQPELSQAHFNLGNALRLCDEWQDAILAYQKALQFKHDHIEAYNNLSFALVHEKQYGQALLVAKKAIAIAPQHGDSWLILCNIAEQCKEYELALEAGTRNISLLPLNHRSWFGYGVALNRLDRHEEAIEAYQKALELKPERADIWDNLGQTYQSLNRLEEAEAAYRKTIEISGQIIHDELNRDVAEEEYGSRHWHLSLLELLRGNYQAGFARYRSRFGNVGGLVRPPYAYPLWKGENLKGKTLLVGDEQGYGDTIMLSRYLPLLKERGVRIHFSVHSVLKPLFENWGFIDKLLEHGETIKDIDFHASVFDLPHRFKTTLATIPATVPYLPLFTPTTTTKLSDGNLPKIGVVWGGSPLHLNDHRRSIPLRIFATLFKNKSFEFYSLNRDKKSGDDLILPQLSVRDLAPHIHSFADAARFIQQLDLVITSDTATAHLAGALGKRVWILLPYAPDWRWLINRTDSPWYPTARLFRQNEIGNWETVIHTVFHALQSFKG